jgi:hypothetical protein
LSRTRIEELRTQLLEEMTRANFLLRRQVGVKNETPDIQGRKRRHPMPSDKTTAVPYPLHITDEELYQRVARKAYELYQQRGEIAGHDLNDWLTAERLVRAELLHGSAVDREGEALAEEETE